MRDHETTQAVYGVCGWYITFKKGSAIDNIAPMREAWPTRTELGIFWSAFLWTFITFRAPGHADWAAASIYTVFPLNRSPTAFILMGEVTLLCTQVWKSQTHILHIYVTWEYVIQVFKIIESTKYNITKNIYSILHSLPTNACSATDIYSHSWRTLTEKGPWCVDAFAIDTHSGKHLTLIHIWETAEKKTCPVFLINSNKVWISGSIWNQSRPYLHRHFLSP